MKIIDLPDTDDTKTEHRSLYREKNMKAVACAAGSSSTAYSRRMNAEETVVNNPIHEVICEMVGSVKSGQPEIGKGVFKIIYRYAQELGLVDEEPVDILDLANKRLRAISQEQIRLMGERDRTLLEVYAGELENEAGRVKSSAIIVRRECEVWNQPIESPHG